MAKVSQNGWTGIKSGSDARLTNFPYVTGKVRKGDIYVILDWVAKEYEKSVEDIRKDWSWGWNYRNIRGASSLSNHAMAGAVDFNAPRHPLGVSPTRTMTSAQIKACHSIASRTGGVIRWGGAYAGRKDTMHWEINANAARVARLADEIRGSAKPQGNVEVGKPKPRTDKVTIVYKGLTESQTRSVQEYLRSTDDYNGAIDGKYGPMLKAAVIQYTKRQNKYGGAKFKNDGEWGPKTQEWFEWVRLLQKNVAKWKASERLGKMLADGDYGPRTNRHVAAVQKSNLKAYIKLGGGAIDGQAGKITCQLIKLTPFKW